MATKDEKPIEVLADFDVLEPIEHNGVTYRVGDKVSLTDKEAAELIAFGIVK